MTDAANVELETIWAALLAKALEGKDVKELLSNVGSGGGAPAVGAAAAGGAAPAAAAAEEKEEEAKEEEKEESDEDMVRFRLLLDVVIPIVDQFFRVSVFSTNFFFLSFLHLSSIYNMYT